MNPVYTKQRDIPLKVIIGERETSIDGTPFDFVNLYRDSWDSDQNKRPDISEIRDRLKDIKLTPVYHNEPSSTGLLCFNPLYLYFQVMDTLDFVKILTKLLDLNIAIRTSEISEPFRNEDNDRRVNISFQELSLIIKEFNKLNDVDQISPQIDENSHELNNAQVVQSDHNEEIPNTNTNGDQEKDLIDISENSYISTTSNES
ncbi:14255_t:CDS:2, partial [Gigaspora margarita]